MSKGWEDCSLNSNVQNNDWYCGSVCGGCIYLVDEISWDCLIYDLADQKVLNDWRKYDGH